MPDSTDKFYSDVLSEESVRLAMDALPDVFRSLLGDCLVTAFYGFGTAIHADLQSMPMTVGTRWIDRFIADSVRQGIVIPGRCDFLFTIPDERLEVLFCHESDIHLNGKDDAMIRQFIAAQPFSGFHFRPKAERMAVG